MERELTDNINLSSEKINELEEQRIDRLNKAGVDEQEVLNKANERLNIWNSYFNENIVRGKDDVNFTIRDQWTAVERSEFTRLFQVPMTFNKLYGAVKKIVGEQRKNKPDLIVRSLTGRATQEQINLRSDLVRTISYQSQNDLVYQTAFKSALVMGYGAFQICLDYESPYSSKKIIRYEMIPDCTRTAFDATALKPHKGDGNYCARFYVFTRDEFFATYPYATNPSSYIDPYMLLDFQWSTRDTITVCDYFVKEWFSFKLFKLSNGMDVTESEWERMQKKIKAQKEITKDSEVGRIIDRETPRIISERISQDYKIMHYRMIRDQILDFSQWPSKHLPIIFVDGDSYYIEGRQYTKSFIHEARDAQKCINYFNSQIMTDVKNRRREQWVVTPDNIKGFEQEWRNPEVQQAALRAVPDPKTGMMPQKMPAWDISPGLLQNAMRANQELNEIMGISENEELRGRDISGNARRERKIETSMSSYVYFDNNNQAIEQGGRVVLDLLPEIVGEEERSMVISRRDGKTETVVLNERLADGSVRNQLGDGNFDIEIDTGPSFAVQKDTALELFTATLQAYPQAFPLIADLWAANLDLQWMPQIKERFKTIVPPEILAKEEGRELPPAQPSPQDQMAAMQQQMMQQEIQLKEQQLQEKQARLQLEAEKQEMDKQKLAMDAQKMLFDLETDKSAHNLQTAKLMVELKRIIADSKNVKEKNLQDHHIKMSQIAA